MRATRTARDGAATDGAAGHGRDTALDWAGGSPFVDFDRAAWARLGENVPLPLTADELARLRSLGDAVDLDEVREVYLPLSRLLTLHVQETRAAVPGVPDVPRRAQEARTPFVIGIAGSVSVGKSTTARLLRAAAGALAAAPAGGAGHDRRVPVPERGAGAARADGAQGLPGVLRPAGAAAVRHAR